MLTCTSAKDLHVLMEPGVVEETGPLEHLVMRDLEMANPKGRLEGGLEMEVKMADKMAAINKMAAKMENKMAAIPVAIAKMEAKIVQMVAKMVAKTEAKMVAIVQMVAIAQMVATGEIMEIEEAVAMVAPRHGTRVSKHFPMCLKQRFQMLCLAKKSL